MYKCLYGLPVDVLLLCLMVPSLFLSCLRYALYDIIVLLLISNYVLVNVSCFIWGGGRERGGGCYTIFCVISGVY